MRLVELDYVADTAVRFSGLAERPWSVLLDSGRERVSGARYDVYASDPYVTLTTRGGITEVRGRESCRTSHEDPLALLHAELAPASAPDRGLPFYGGAIGYFAYDLGRRFERWPALAASDIDLPELAIGLYDWAVVVDHFESRSWLVGQGRDEKTFDCWRERLDEIGASPQKIHPSFEVRGSVRSNFSRATYGRAFDRIKAHIGAGDCYQVNLAQRFSADVSGSSWSAYERLRAGSPAPFSAFLNLPFGQVLCSSPERFLRITGDHVMTQPIKGTRPRGADPSSDEELKAELRHSAKDRAENVMIVDLLRNDLGKSCAPGTVGVTKLFDVETFANVHHLVSTIEGRLASGKSALDVVRGAFPGGSITGAPKVRAMQIIEECEPQRRSVYCGTIGYVGFDGNMDSNIAIRTLVRAGPEIHAWAGSGIVADSDVGLEYQECLDKVSGLLAVLDGARIGAAC